MFKRGKSRIKKVSLNILTYSGFSVDKSHGSSWPLQGTEIA
jgi:hypothetical protein